MFVSRVLVSVGPQVERRVEGGKGCGKKLVEIRLGGLCEVEIEIDKSLVHVNLDGLTSVSIRPKSTPAIVVHTKKAVSLLSISSSTKCLTPNSSSYTSWERSGPDEIQRCVSVL